MPCKNQGTVPLDPSPLTRASPVLGQLASARRPSTRPSGHTGLTHQSRILLLSCHLVVVSLSPRNLALPKAAVPHLVRVSHAVSGNERHARVPPCSCSSTSTSLALSGGRTPETASKAIHVVADTAEYMARHSHSADDNGVLHNEEQDTYLPLQAPGLDYGSRRISTRVGPRSVRAPA